MDNYYTFNIKDGSALAECTIMWYDGDEKYSLRSEYDCYDFDYDDNGYDEDKMYVSSVWGIFTVCDFSGEACIEYNEDGDVEEVMLRLWEYDEERRREFNRYYWWSSNREYDLLTEMRNDITEWRDNNG